MIWKETVGRQIERGSKELTIVLASFVASKRNHIVAPFPEREVDGHGSETSCPRVFVRDQDLFSVDMDVGFASCDITNVRLVNSTERHVGRKPQTYQLHC